MAYRGHTVLAVVPARGGSKGLPGKNLRTVGGISLVGRAARAALAVPGIDRAVITTDDASIAADATRHGLDCPFMRPAELASDEASSVQAWQHAWTASEAHYGNQFELSVLLEPTSPLRRAEDITRTLDALLDGNHAAAATLSPTPAHYTPHKTLTIAPDGRVGFYLPDGARHARRQTVPDYYHRNGLCYAVRRSTLVEHGHILEEDCAAVVVDRPVVNIDDAFELELAEWLLTRESAHEHP